MLKNIIQKIKTAPKDPGVYIFYKNKIPLYIGKTSNLKNRLQSYLKITDFKTEALYRESNKLKILKLGSNIEALITESQLIKNLKPAYNVLCRDDKNYFYVAVTKDNFPRIFLCHQLNEYPGANYIGPFTEGRTIKVILRLLRKFFPYCTHNPHFRICLDTQINNCPGHCCNKQITATKQQANDYKKSIAKIENVLTGKNKKFVHQLKDPYELLVLEKIWQHKPYLETGRRTFSIEQHANHLLERSPSPALRDESPAIAGRGREGVDPPAGGEIARAEGSLLNEKVLRKIECYDNSHLSGKEAVGAMTSWRLRRPQTNADFSRLKRNFGSAKSALVREVREWVADKSMWRKFRIRRPKQSSMRKAHANYFQDDPAMMEQIISRRLNHPEWPYPDLIIIDGGITQLNAAKKAIQKSNVKGQMSNVVRVISFAKPQQLVFGLEKYPISLSRLPEEFQKLISTAIQNTHNFAIQYHRSIRRRDIIKL